MQNNKTNRFEMQYDFSYTKLTRGLIAITAVIMLSIGALAYLLVSFGASVWYADSVERREFRIQEQLNQKACEDTKKLIQTKDYFKSKNVKVSDFGCEV